MINPNQKPMFTSATLGRPRHNDFKRAEPNIYAQVWLFSNMLQNYRGTNSQRHALYWLNMAHNHPRNFGSLAWVHFLLSILWTSKWCSTFNTGSDKWFKENSPPEFLKCRMFQNSNLSAQLAAPKLITICIHCQ